MLGFFCALGASALLLAGCVDEAAPKGDVAPPPPVDMAVDMAKVESVVADFHFQFFDAQKRLVQLNDAELAAYLKLRDERAAAYRKTYKYDDYYGGWPIGDGGTPAPPPQLPYERRCGDASVPLPPPWQEGNWTQVGVLPLQPLRKVHSGPEHTPNEIWESTSDKGVCAAITRQVKGGGDREVAYVCQSRETGNTCFWALRDPANNCTKPFPVAQQKGKRVDQICSGDTMAQNENCTECHRGINAFIVHPRTALAIASEDPDKRYTPVPVRRRIAAENATWENDGILKLENNDKCGQCHTFSFPRLRWCNLVLKGALGNLTSANIAGREGVVTPLAQTMPIKQDRFSTVIPRATYLKDFKSDLRTLLAACIIAGGTADIGIAVEELQ